MSSLSVYCCPRCGVTNDPSLERCHQCKQLLNSQIALKGAQWQGIPLPLSKAQPRMSRRTAILVGAGITVGVAALPIVATAAYLAYQKQIDPHILTYSGHDHTTLDAVWSSDGTRVASAGWWDGGTVQVWDATTGKRLQTCQVERPLQGIFPLKVIWSSDGKYVLAFVGWDKSMVLAAGSRIVEMVQVWDAATGQRVRSIPVMEPVTVNALGTGTDQPLIYQWALNERYLVTAKSRPNTAYEQHDDMLEIWDIATGSKIAPLDAESQRPAGQVVHIVWAPDNEKLAIHWNTRDTIKGKYYQTIEIWDIATGNKIATLDVDQVQEIVWAPDNRMLAISSSEGSAVPISEVWNALAGERLQTFKRTVVEKPLIAWSPDGKSLVLGTEVYDVETGNRITTYTIQGMVDSLVWSPDGTRVALVDLVNHGRIIGSISSTLSVLDALSGKQRAKYDGGGLLATSGRIED